MDVSRVAFQIIVPQARIHKDMTPVHWAGSHTDQVTLCVRLLHKKHFPGYSNSIKPAQYVAFLQSEPKEKHLVIPIGNRPTILALPHQRGLVPSVVHSPSSSHTLLCSDLERVHRKNMNRDMILTRKAESHVKGTARQALSVHKITLKTNASI